MKGGRGGGEGRRKGRRGGEKEGKERRGREGEREKIANLASKVIMQPPNASEQ